MPTVKTFRNFRFLDKIDLDEVKKEVEWLYADLESQKIPVTLCHNDIWRSNLLYDSGTGKIIHSLSSCKLNICEMTCLVLIKATKGIHKAYQLPS